MAVIHFTLLHYYNGLTFEEIENYKGHFAVILHASFLFLMLLVREMIKDLENIKGDLASGYRTILFYTGRPI
jgi:4-hydroxybenzoate polyprenyltransferase